jgi:hypothetical protein
MLDIVLCLLDGIQETSIEHLIARFIICVIPIYSLSLFKYFQNLPLYIVLLFHYGITCGLVIVGVFGWSFVEELHPDAYIDIFRSYSMMYAIVYVSAVLTDLLRTRRANRELKQINNIYKESKQ